MPEVTQVQPTKETSLSPDPNTPEASLGKASAVQAALQKADSGLDPSKLTALLAGKYRTEEDLYKGILNILPKAGGTEVAVELYKQLESRLGKPADQRGEIKLPDPIPPAEPSADTKGSEPSQPSGETPPDEKKMDFAELGREFSENNGTLKPESYERLAKAGFNRSMVDTYMLGLRAQVESIHALAGGKETFTEMLDWGVENYTEAERAAFDDAITNGTQETRAAAVNMLRARFTQSRGPIKSVTPQSGNMNPSGAVGFASQAEFVRALGDPRYRKDPAYQEEVMRRLASSKNI